MSDHNVECQSAVIGCHPSQPVIAIAQGCHLVIYSAGNINTVETAHTALIRAVAFSLDGAVIASVADDKILNIADAKSGRLLAKHTFDKKLTCVCFTDRNVVVGDRFGVVYMIDNVTSNDAAVVTEILGHIETITTLSMLPSMIISADIDSKIRCSNWPRTYDIESFCFGHRG
jgi:WD40 repeat protein